MEPLALAPVHRVLNLATAPASGLMGQLKTLSEGAPESEGEGEGARSPRATPAARPGRGELISIRFPAAARGVVAPQ